MLADFRLEDWTIRPRRACIERDDEVVHVHPKSMAVLERLAAADGEVVTRDEIFEAVWPGVVVTDDALTQCVVELRKAFGDPARDPRIIKTIPKIGFRLVPPVLGLDEKRENPVGRFKILAIAVLGVVAAIFVLYKVALVGEEPTETATIVVLPFLNMSADPEQEYFSDGVSEELLNLLAKIPNLKVISRTSAFSFKGKDVDIPTIAQRLNNATHVLEGSVRRSGDKIRVTAQLVDARLDTHLWSHSYDRGFEDIFTIQDEIARQVVDAVKVTLLGEYPRSAPVDPEAYRLYLLGKYHLNKYEFPKALVYFKQALALDPNYAKVHLAIASLYGGKTWFGYMSPRDGYEEIKAEIALAVEKDSQLPEAQRSIASVNFYYEWDWIKAEEAFERAIALIPNDARTYQSYTWFLSAMNRTQQAQVSIRRGLEIEPLAPPMYLTASYVHYLTGEHNQAIAQCEKALELNPNHSYTLSQIGWSYVQLGRFEEAINTMEQSVRISPDNTQLLWSLGHAYAVAGNAPQARKVLGDLHKLAEERYVTPYGFAMIHTGLGETREALDWLEMAYKDRSVWMVYLQMEPRLDPLRAEPRFQDLLERMDFPD
jgi:serine/threonine-protein kinase